jgi:four helix bundle protein
MSTGELRIQTVAGEIADEIANLVRSWQPIDQGTIGAQMIRSADSIGNNISEGYGRVGTGERLQFFFYADASLQELRNQIKRCANRTLVTEEWSVELDQRLLRLSISILEFARAVLDRDETYKGPYRDRLMRRMWWRKEREENDSENPS